ncbi:MAG: hypothetical protein QM713_05045 [Arachnia sp.]
MKRFLVVLGVVVLVAGMVVGGLAANRYFYERFTPERCTVTVGEVSTTLTSEQAANASIIVAASVQRGLPERAAVVALATAYQESGLRNLDYGDRDSLGLFQQRPSYGWGSEEEIMDPWYASNRFYEEIVKFDDWETTDVNDMAQKVQRSGHPEAYRKHEANAQAVADALLGAPASLSCVNFDVGAPAPEAFTEVLDAIGAKYTIDGDTVLIFTDGEAETWRAGNMAVANNYAGGIRMAVVNGRQWKADHEGWATATTGHDDASAVLWLGKR